MEEYIFYLKDFTNIIKIEYDVLQEVNTIVDNFSFQLTFYNKYEKVFKSLEFVE